MARTPRHVRFGNRCIRPGFSLCPVWRSLSVSWDETGYVDNRVRRTALTIRTQLREGGPSLNHNEALRVRPALKAGDIQLYGHLLTSITRIAFVSGIGV